MLDAACLGVGFVELLVLKHLKFLFVHSIASLPFFGLHLVILCKALIFNVFYYFFFVVKVLDLRPIDLAIHFLKASLYDFFFIFEYFVQNLVFAFFFFALNVFRLKVQSPGVNMSQNVS